MNMTRQSFRARSTLEIDKLTMTRLAVAEESVYERAERARQRFTPAPGRFKPQSMAEAAALRDVGDASPREAPLRGAPDSD
jgi:hypothetical protein